MHAAIFLLAPQRARSAPPIVLARSTLPHAHTRWSATCDARVNLRRVCDDERAVVTNQRRLSQCLALFSWKTVRHSLLAGTFECTVHAYCLMTNHVHLLLTPRRADGSARSDEASRSALCPDGGKQSDMSPNALGNRRRSGSRSARRGRHSCP